MTGIKDLAEFGSAGQNLVALCLLLVAGVLLLYAALHDVAVRTVPDWLSVAMLVLGVGLRLLDHGLLEAVIIAGITFAVLFMLWLLGFMGGGDVKLWTATVLIVPPIIQPEINFFLYITTFGGVLALIYLGLGRLIRRPLASRHGGLWRRALRVEAWRISNRGPLPYACAIAFGAFATLLPLSL